MSELTRREKIIALLIDADKPLTLREIANILEEKERTIERDMKHVSKTIRRKYKGKRLVMYPAVCRKCGYTLRSDNINPGKCPKCKSEWLEKPRFQVIEK